MLMHPINYEQMPTNTKYEMLIKVLQRAKEDVWRCVPMEQTCYKFQRCSKWKCNQRSRLEEEGDFNRGSFDKNL
jgi:hypothetical protein